MSNKNPDLGEAYSLKTPEDSRRLYSDWARTYDSDFADRMDYQLPERVADAFVDAGGTGPALDVGAGTGLVGVRLSERKIEPVDGTDISQDMLEAARQKRVYRNVFTADITKRVDVSDGTYRGILSAGTFTLGHVGPDALDELFRIAAPGALFAISVNREHWESAGFAAKFFELEGQICNLRLPDVRIYGEGAKGDHASDIGKIAVFWKV